MRMFEPVPLALLDSDFALFAQRLGDSYRQTGFAVISGHAIPQPLIDDVHARFRAFFAQPAALKARYHVPGGGGARGYTPFGIETAKGAAYHDLKEFWHIGRDLPPGHPYRHYMPDNIWPTDDPACRSTCLALFGAFDALGQRLLAAIARTLELPLTYFNDKVEAGNSILRILHYPPVAGDVPHVRAGAHEDINVITLLLGAEEGGLEVLGRDGRWLPLNPPPGCLVVNIGDMLQRLTNHVLPSTTHRVVNPVPERAGIARHAMPFFLHFNPDFVIRTLPGCISAANPDRYPDPIRADDYLQERLRDIKLT